MAKRFATFSEEDITKKRKESIPVNTTKNNKTAAETLRQYLIEQGDETNFELFTEQKLSEVLGHFYLSARTNKGELYKKKGLEGLRYSINRYLKAPPYLKKFDIISSEQFSEANELYKTAISEIKSAGKGDIDHYKQIHDADLIKLYHSVHLTPETPTGLMNRVQMNIRLYFCRRANENMASMTKDTFKVGSYPSGKRFIYKAQDELTKNHRSEDTEIISAHMPEEPDNKMLCPVETYMKYVSKLNPNCERLWQYPKNEYSDEDNVWYQNKPLGRDTLSKFMSRLSQQVPLSNHYTNHCIRVTGTSILSRCNFSSAQIMSVTGHKSVSSLAVYQRVSEQEKSQMGSEITKVVANKNQSQAALTSSHPILALPCPQSAVVPRTDEVSLNDINIDDLFSDFDSLAPVPQVNNSLNMLQQVQRAPMFNNCTISGLTINVNVNVNK